MLKQAIRGRFRASAGALLLVPLVFCWAAGLDLSGPFSNLAARAAAASAGAFPTFQLSQRLPTAWPATVTTSVRNQLAAEQARLDDAARWLQETPAQVAMGAVPAENWEQARALWNTIDARWTSLVESLTAPDKVEEIRAQVSDDLQTLLRLAIPSRSVEIRILAVDASSFSSAYLSGDLDFILRLAKGTGFNAIFLEVQRDDGYLVYPSAVGVEAPDLAAKGVSAEAESVPAGSAQVQGDPLAEFIAKAHEEGIAVFPWIKLLFATASGEPGPILSQHPEWTAKTQDGKMATTPYNLVWFNPAHPGVRDFLTRLLGELAQRYPIDGVQLDYVRYPNQYGVPTDYSYDDYTVEQVKMLYGFDPRTLPYPPLGQIGSASYQVGDLPQALQEWNSYREEIISSLVGRVVRAVHAQRPGLPISVAPFAATWGGGTYQQALTIHQNWPVWLDRHLALLLSPLTYSDSARVVGRELSNIQKLAAGRALTAPSLSIPQVNLTDAPGTELLRQVDAVQEQGSAGYRIFAFPYLRPEHWQALRQGPFRRPAINPVLAPEQAAAQLVDDLTRLVSQMPADEAAKQADAILQRLRSQVEQLVTHRSPAGTGSMLVDRTAAEVWNTVAYQAAALTKLAAGGDGTAQAARTTSSPDGTTAELLAGAWPVLYRNALELQNLATAFAYQGRPAALNPSLPAGL